MSESVETDLRRVILQTLESWHAAGITHLTSIPALTTAAQPVPPVAKIALLPVEVSAPPAAPVPAAVIPERPAKLPVSVSMTETTPEVTAPDMAQKPVVKPQMVIDQAEQATAAVAAVPPASRPEKKDSRSERITELQVLSQKVAQCTRCTELAATRTQTVFGVGNPEARLVFIGEAPGADEDAQGEPFVGQAGQLLNKIIEAMKLKREEIYICNILRCRPPGNRLPSPEEAGHCREYLDGQLGIIKPEYIVCWGACAAQNLLNVVSSIGKMRGRFYQYNGAKVLCTYHPSYLLRNPAAKKDVWEDMKFLMREMGLPLD